MTERVGPLRGCCVRIIALPPGEISRFWGAISVAVWGYKIRYCASPVNTLLMYVCMYVCYIISSLFAACEVHWTCGWSSTMAKVVVFHIFWYAKKRVIFAYFQDTK